MNLKQYAALVMLENPKCPAFKRENTFLKCGYTFCPEDLVVYGASKEGWLVDGYPKKMGLALQCSVCQWRTSLRDFGIERPEPRDFSMVKPRTTNVDLEGL